MKKTTIGKIKCSCGKTAKEHKSIWLLSVHHFWYFHKDIIKGCRYCESLTGMKSGLPGKA